MACYYRKEESTLSLASYLCTTGLSTLPIQVSRLSSYLLIRVASCCPTTACLNPRCLWSETESRQLHCNGPTCPVQLYPATTDSWLNPWVTPERSIWETPLVFPSLTSFFSLFFHPSVLRFCAAFAMNSQNDGRTVQEKLGMMLLGTVFSSMWVCFPNHCCCWYEFLC